MNKTYKFPALWMMCLMLFSCLTFTACDNGDDEDTNQYKGGINLNVFGPSPVARGGVLRFLGSGMDKADCCYILGLRDITDIEVAVIRKSNIVPPDSPAGVGCLEDSEGGYYNKNRVDIYGAD